MKGGHERPEQFLQRLTPIIFFKHFIIANAMKMKLNILAKLSFIYF